MTEPVAPTGGPPANAKRIPTSERTQVRLIVKLTQNLCFCIVRNAPVRLGSEKLHGSCVVEFALSGQTIPGSTSQLNRLNNSRGGAAVCLTNCWNSCVSGHFAFRRAHGALATKAPSPLRWFGNSPSF